MKSEHVFDRFSEEAQAALARARLLAGTEGAHAVEVSHLRRSIDEVHLSPGPAISVWASDAKRVLELALRWSLQRNTERVELADLRIAIHGWPDSGSAPRSARVVLPAEIAEELIESGCAVRPFITRGGALSEPISVAVEAINTGSALVSIGLAITTCKRLAAAAVRRRRATDSDDLTISVTVNGKTESLQLDRTAADAEDKAFDFFVTALDVE